MALKLVKNGDNYAAETDARVSAVLDWLASPLSGDPVSELVPLCTHLDTLADLEMGSGQYHRILDLFQTRAHKVADELKPRFRDATVPLTRHVRGLAKDLMAVHGAVAASYQRILERMEPGAVVGRRRNPTVVAARALKSLADQLQVSALVSMRAPAGLWAAAHTMYREAKQDSTMQETLADQSLDVDRIYREMLALGAAQPPRLSPAEVLLTVDYVARFAAAVEISDRQHAEPDYRKFWFDTTGDMQPVAVARKLPPAGETICHLSCVRLGMLAAEQVRELEAGTPAEHLHLPDVANDSAYRGLLRRLHDGWVDPPTRQLARRRHNYQVEACVGIEAVQRLMSQGTDAAEVPEGMTLSSWFVMNQSPAGFAALHVSGEVSGLRSGGVVALRAGPGKPWDLCLVRWLNADDPDHAEMGLQVLASEARLVGVAFRNARDSVGVVKGLLLPPMSAVRSRDSLLVPAGTCESRRFLMLVEEGRTHIVQGRVVSLDIQTAEVELFQFDPDPYPI